MRRRPYPGAGERSRGSTSPSRSPSRFPSRSRSRWPSPSRRCRSAGASRRPRLLRGGGGAVRRLGTRWRRGACGGGSGRWGRAAGQGRLGGPPASGPSSSPFPGTKGRLGAASRPPPSVQGAPGGSAAARLRRVALRVGGGGGWGSGSRTELASGVKLPVAELQGGKQGGWPGSRGEGNTALGVSRWVPEALNARGACAVCTFQPAVCIPSCSLQDLSPK